MCHPNKALYAMPTIYNHARGDGWILTSTAPVDEWEKTHGGHRVPIALYYTHDQRVEMHMGTNRNGSPLSTFYSQYLDIGAKLGPYEGTFVEVSVDYDDQPRAVRMQRHAPDIYQALGGARGFSETMAVRAAETFGSRWRGKHHPDDWQRIDGIGEGRASSIVDHGESVGVF